MQFNEEAILKDAGRVTHEVALVLAEKEFEKFHAKRNKNIESDFDKVVKKLYEPDLKERKESESEK